MSTSRSTLKEIRFIDGDIELQQFPQHLLRALERNCRAIRSNIPTCTRSIGSSAIGLVDGREAHFRTRSTGEKLLQARFKYGTNQQITIVRERSGHSVNGGRAVIVTGVPGGPGTLTSPAGITFNQVAFQIWSSSTLLRHTKASGTDIVRLIRATKEDESTETQAPTGALMMQTLDATVDVQDETTSPVTPTLAQSRTANSEDVTMGEDSVSSDSDVPLINSSQQSRTTHGSAVQDLSGAALVSSSRHQHPNSRSQGLRSNGVSASMSPLTERTAHNSGEPPFPTPTICSPPPLVHVTAVSTAPNSISQNLNFVFKENNNSRVLRTKSATICSSIEKLFAQASLAGIITKDSFMLRLLVNTETFSKEERVIRGDPEDFQAFMQDVKHHGDIDIMVLPGGE